MALEAQTSGNASSFYAHADGERFEIALPRLCGARQGADALISRLNTDVEGKIVVLNARLTTVGSRAYADELLALLRVRGVDAIEVTPTTAAFEEALLTAAESRSIRLTLLR